MKFNPLDEVEVSGLLPKGDYEFEVLEAMETLSKSSNKEMIKLVIKVETPSGQDRIIYDYLLADGGMAYKLRHFCGSIGLIESYENGELKGSDCVEKRGILKLGVSESNGFAPKNSVLDYIVSEKKLNVVKNEDVNEDVPF